MPQEELERDVYATGFFRQKAKSLRGTMRVLLEEFDGRVPRTIPELLRLPGVARKTANVVAAELGNPQGVVVDTHVRRLSQRLGLTKHEDPVKIERDLAKLVPRADWGRFPHLLIWHGRRICDARRPLCEECVSSTISARRRGSGQTPARMEGSFRRQARRGTMKARLTARRARPDADGVRPRRVSELDRLDGRLDHPRLQRLLVPVHRLPGRVVVDRNLELLALPPHPERQPRDRQPLVQPRGQRGGHGRPQRPGAGRDRPTCGVRHDPDGRERRLRLE